MVISSKCDVTVSCDLVCRWPSESEVSGEAQRSKVATRLCAGILTILALYVIDQGNVVAV